MNCVTSLQINYTSLLFINQPMVELDENIENWNDVKFFYGVKNI
jgi:hypothetical protein